MVYSTTITRATRGFSDIHDITGLVQETIDRSGVNDGIATASVIGSTASLSTIEYEPALVQDLKDILEKIAPQTMHSRHSETWGDDNGFSHLRATLMGPSVTIPISNAALVLGTWQQIILIDHDNRPRERSVFIQITGE